MLNDYEKQIQLIKDLKITPYGSFLKACLSPNSVQRIRIFSMFGFRCIMTPQHWSMINDNRDKKIALAILGFALDNGAYTCHTKKTEFPERAFEFMIKEIGHGADWIAIPDVVGNKEATLKKAPNWIRRCRQLSPRSRFLLVYQDEMNEKDLKPYLEDGIGVFIGGTDSAKLEALKWVPDLCKENGQYCHVGRVNSKKRIKLCINSGANSFDGSSYSRFLPSFSVVRDIIDQNGQTHLFSLSNHDELMCRKFLRRRDEILDVFNITEQDIKTYVRSAKKINVDGLGNRKKGSKGYRDLSFLSR